MKSNKTCHIDVAGDDVSPEEFQHIERRFDDHNYTEKLDMVLKKNDYEQISDIFLNTPIPSTYLVAGSVFNLVKYALSLEKTVRQSLRLYTPGQNLMHDNSLCIRNGKLILKLREDTYLSSGLSLSKSKFSAGNKKFYQQMYIGHFDLLNFSLTSSGADRNNVRLLWFIENVWTESHQFVLSFDNESPLDTNEGLADFLKSGLKVLKKDHNSFDVLQLDSCNVPDLTIIQDEDNLMEIHEFFSYAMIGGLQLNEEKPVDPYLSRYVAMQETVGKLDLVVVTLKSKLISISTIKKILLELKNKANWYALGAVGVTNVANAYNNNSEHGFIDDGANDLLLFVNEGKYALWEVNDSGESHHP